MKAIHAAMMRLRYENMWVMDKTCETTRHHHSFTEINSIFEDFLSARIET